MDTVRLGVIGAGGMGTFHVTTLHEIAGVRLAAVCDARPERAQAAIDKAAKIRAGLPGGGEGQAGEVRAFESHEAMLDSGAVDAILIATPHPLHPVAAVAAFGRGVHVLCEKPLAPSVKAARHVIAEHAKRPELVFSLMLQMRTVPLYKKIRSLVTEGELGEITRVTWIVTDWFRTWAYYASGGWRATWTGEGGGVLINQCPHNLDLLQWLTGGMTPGRVTAVGFVGKTHPVEVEDEVSAVLEYPNGAIGHFVTTTGEAPGTNRLEIAGDRGKLVAEHGKLTFYRTRQGVREVRETSKEAFAQVETWQVDVPLPGGASDAPHKVITQNFVNAILKGEPLIAPGAEGVRGLEIGNAMAMSGLTRRPVELPLDGDAYEAFLQDMNRRYGGRKTLETREAVSADMGTSFSKP